MATDGLKGLTVHAYPWGMVAGIYFNMRRKRIIPKIVIVHGDLPDWLVSRLAAYDWTTQTIWLNDKVPRQALGYYFCHEVGHHIIELVCGKHRVHDIYDKVCFDLFCKEGRLVRWIRRR